MKKIFLYILFFVCIIFNKKKLLAQVTYDISVQKIEFINPATQTVIEGNPVPINNTLPIYQLNVVVQAVGILPLNAPDSISTTLTVLHPNGTNQQINKTIPIILPNEPFPTLLYYLFQNNDTSINGANTFAFSINTALNPAEETDYTNNGVIQAAYINAYVVPLGFNYNELKNNEIRIYPTVMYNTNTLNYSTSIALQNAVLQIFDQTGRLITQTNIEQNGTILLPSSVAKGMYFVQVKNAQGMPVATQKILKF